MNAFEEYGNKTVDKFPIAASKERLQLKEKINTYYNELIYGRKQQKELKKDKTIRTPDPTIKEILKLRKDIIKFDGEIKLFRETQRAFNKRNISQNGVRVRKGGLFGDNLADETKVYHKYLDAYRNQQSTLNVPKTYTLKPFSTTRKKISLLKAKKMPIGLPKVDDVKRVKGIIIKEFKNLKVARNEVRNIERYFPKIELLKLNRTAL